MLLSKIEIKFKKNEKLLRMFPDVYTPQNLGVKLQGVIMSKISSEYADSMHYQGNKFNELRPYSQYCYYDNEQLVWVISTVGEEAKKNIIDVLLLEESITFTGSDITLYVDSIKRNSTTLQAIMDKRYTEENDSTAVKFRFASPTIFTRLNNSYIAYPDPYAIFKYLLDKYSALSKDFDVNTDETLNYLKSSVKIIDFSIKSLKSGEGKCTFGACIGSVVISFNTTKEYGTFLRILADLSEYTGIGLKTARGFGGVVPTVYETKKKK